MQCAPSRCHSMSVQKQTLKEGKKVRKKREQTLKDKKVGETKRQEKEAEVDSLNLKVMRLEEALSQMQEMFGTRDTSTLLGTKPSELDSSKASCG